MVNFKTVLLLQSHFGRGAYIVRQGAAGDTFYIITEGKVKVTQKKEGKSSCVLVFYFPFDKILPFHSIPESKSVVEYHNIINNNEYVFWVKPRIMTSKKLCTQEVLGCQIGQLTSWL